jgi:ankyrin repeat protein
MEKNRYIVLLKVLFSAVFILSTVDQSSSMRSDQVVASRLETAALLRLAVKSKKTRMVKRLVTNGADINMVDEEGNTLLTGVASLGDVNMTLFLIDNGAEVNKQNNEGCSPLHFAAIFGYWGVIEILLNRNANINLKDNKGFTPAHWAAMSGNREIVKFLEAQGADLTIKSKYGQTPWDMVVLRN